MCRDMHDSKSVHSGVPASLRIYALTASCVCVCVRVYQILQTTALMPNEPKYLSQEEKPEQMKLRLIHQEHVPAK